MKILVIDDNILVVKKISFYLQKQGHEIIETTSAMDALPKILKLQPDLVISDLLMPYVTGNELYKTLNNLNNSQTKMLFITSLKKKYLKDLDDQLDTNLVLTKPINYGNLDSKIAALVAA